MKRVPPCDEKSQCLRFAPAPESESTRFLPVVVAICKVANGEVVPNPKFPVEESKRNPPTPAFPNRTVEDAFSPPRSESAVEVALVFTPKFTVGVHENVPLPEPQAVPVLEMRPVTENCAQPVLPPALETRRSVVEAVPETVRAVVEAYRKIDAVVEVDMILPARKMLPWMESAEPAEVVPMPTFCEKYERPTTSRMLFEVAVALLPMMRTSVGSVG